MKNIFELSDIPAENLIDILELYCNLNELIYDEDNKDFFKTFASQIANYFDTPTTETLSTITDNLMTLLNICYSHIIDTIEDSALYDNISYHNDITDFTMFLKMYIPKSTKTNCYDNNSIEDYSDETIHRYITLFHDIILNIYINHKHKQSSSISLKKLAETCDKLSTEDNCTFPYIKKFSKSKLSTILKNNHFWCSHYYSHILGVNSDNEEDKKNHYFSDCFPWFQMFLLQIQHNSPQSTNNSPEKHHEPLLPSAYYPNNHAIINSSPFSYNINDLSDTLRLFEYTFDRFTNSLEDYDINKIIFSYLSKKACSHTLVNEINHLFYHDYERLSIIHDTIKKADAKDNTDAFISHLYKNYYYYFHTNINCLLQVCNIPLVSSRKHILDYVNYLINDITLKTYELLPDNISKPAPLYYHANHDALYEITQYKEKSITEFNTENTDSNKYAQKLEACYNHLATLETKFIPLLQELFYKLLCDTIDVAIYKNNLKITSNEILTFILEQLLTNFTLPENFYDTQQSKELSASNEYEVNSYRYIYSEYLDMINNQINNNLSNSPLSGINDEFEEIKRIKRNLLWKPISEYESKFKFELDNMIQYQMVYKPPKKPSTF